MTEKTDWAIADRLMERAQPGPVQIVVWYNWYMYNVITLDWFSEFYAGSHPTYIDEKYRSYRKDKNSWFMELDNNKRAFFMKLVVEKYGG